MKSKWLIVLALLAILLISTMACGEGGKEEATPTYGLTPTSTPTPTPQPTETGLLPPLLIHFIDVGQGDSILVDLGHTEILIDGGGRSPSVVSYLKEHVDGTLEVMIATHPHADHIGGLIAVLDAFEVQQIWHNGDESTSKTYDEFMDAVENERSEVHIARLHDTIELGELSFYVLHPAELGDDTNNNSVILHLSYGNVDFLFTGDAEAEAEGEMMIRSSVPVPEVEILKVGHHGSRTSSSEAFLDIAQPEVAIYMAGEDNRYGHPHAETLAALKAIGAVIYGTDNRGDIVVKTDGGSYTIIMEK